MVKIRDLGFGNQSFKSRIGIWVVAKIMVPFWVP